MSSLYLYESGGVMSTTTTMEGTHTNIRLVDLDSNNNSHSNLVSEGDSSSSQSILKSCHRA